MRGVWGRKGRQKATAAGDVGRAAASETVDATTSDAATSDAAAGETDAATSAGSRKRRRRRIPRAVDRAITAVAMAVAVILLCLPWAMQRVTELGTRTTLTTATDAVSNLSEEQRAEYMRQATAYNAGIAAASGAPHDPSPLPEGELPWAYDRQLTYERDPMMSWVEIPSIGVSLPIYHGTTPETLMAGVGHLEGTSLPVGGTSTHCVLTAHSGMPGASMFDDVRLLVHGDSVLVHTMGETVAYEVRGSEVVLPEETSSLRVSPGEDLLTLVTCTPYGVNDHRLLVRCERVPWDGGEEDRSGIVSRVTSRHWGPRDIAFFAGMGGLVVVAAAAGARAAMGRRGRRGGKRGDDGGGEDVGERTGRRRR